MEGRYNPPFDFSPTSPPLFSFGVVSDVQYGDKDDASIVGRTMLFRSAKRKFQYAIDEFRRIHQTETPLQCLLNLGDIIDGRESDEKSREDFEVVLKIIRDVDDFPPPLSLSSPSTRSPPSLPPFPFHHVLGNHCLYLEREFLKHSLRMRSAYYDVLLYPGWRLVVLDTNDISLSWPKEHINYRHSLEYLSSHPELGELDRKYNGGLGEEQIEWLKEILERAESSQERLIVCAHHPLACEGTAVNQLVAWNYEEIQELLCNCPSVVLVLAGHTHVGGYQYLRSIHFVTVEAILECPDELSSAFGVVKIYPLPMDAAQRDSVLIRASNSPEFSSGTLIADTTSSMVKMKGFQTLESEQYNFIVHLQGFGTVPSRLMLVK